MARLRSIDDDALMGRLAAVFADVGYHGASLAMLAEAAGLKKASLYHRFPGGKQEMAEEVLGTVEDWIAAEVVAVAESEAPPADRLTRMASAFDALYHGGSTSCLLNMLSSPGAAQDPFRARTRRAFETLISAFARLARDAGATSADADKRARRAVMLLQGSLVLARGTGDPQPFRDMLDGLDADLL